jgi:LmbE family N-acetylglucosaminyl deacetylase
MAGCAIRTEAGRGLGTGPTPGAPARPIDGPSHPIDAPVHPIDAPGTSEAAWRAWPGLAALPPASVAGWASAVIFAAHPDDEVLGAGGSIALLAAAGARLRVVAVTDGEASHPGRAEAARAELARRRAQERTAALQALGADRAEVIRLGLPDAAEGAWEAELAARVPELTAGFAACLAPWVSDLHADHEAVGRAACRAAGPVLFYPVWMWHWARPRDARVPWGQARRVVLTADGQERKRAAIRCFGSQLEDRGGGAGPVLTEEFAAHFRRGHEVLFPAGGP